MLGNLEDNIGPIDQAVIFKGDVAAQHMVEQTQATSENITFCNSALVLLGRRSEFSFCKMLLFL